MRHFLIVGLGGFLGANARYFLESWALKRFGSHFPYGTLIVNVSGSFLLGLFVAIVMNKDWNYELRLLVATGFLGAFTTFSTYQYHILQMLHEHRYLPALTYTFGSLLIGFVAVNLGFWLGQKV